MAQVLRPSMEKFVLLIMEGFDTSRQGGHFQVYGVDGINLAELWGETPSAYYSKLTVLF